MQVNTATAQKTHNNSTPPVANAQIDALRQPMSRSARGDLVRKMLLRGSGADQLRRILASYQQPLSSALLTKALNNPALASSPAALCLLAEHADRYQSQCVHEAACALLRVGKMSLPQAKDIAREFSYRVRCGEIVQNHWDPVAEIAWAYCRTGARVAPALELFELYHYSAEEAANFVTRAIKGGRITEFSDALTACKKVRELIPFFTIGHNLRGEIGDREAGPMFEAAATLCRSTDDVRALHGVARKTRGMCYPRNPRNNPGGKGWCAEDVVLDGLRSIMTEVSLDDVRELSKCIKGHLFRFADAQAARQWFLDVAEAEWHQANRSVQNIR